MSERTCSDEVHKSRGGNQPELWLGVMSCPVCGAEFQPYRNNQRSCSIRCYRRLPDVMERARIENVADPVRRRRDRLRAHLKRYDMTLERYETMLAEQGDCCVICGELPDPNGIKAASRLHVDHDHVTGKVRALLCTRCNQGVGYFRDDPVLLRAMAEYIERHRKAVADDAR